MHLTKIKIYSILFIITLLNACASGSSIVTGAVRTPIKTDQVQLYLDPPEKYETIGIVKASSDVGWIGQDSQGYAVEELKKQAAKLGANGVLLITNEGKASSTIDKNANDDVNASPVSEKSVIGKAIYVKE